MSVVRAGWVFDYNYHSDGRFVDNSITVQSSQGVIKCSLFITIELLNRPNQPSRPFF